MVQLDYYKTQRKHLLINAETFVTNLGDKFQNIGLGSKLFLANIMIVHEILEEYFVCFVQNIQELENHTTWFFAE
jgi:cell division protein ZapA (FtsZ GTPase activity inhibitor)